VADFSIVFADVSGRLTIADWIDKPTATDPTRLNPRAHVPHRYARFRLGASESAYLELHAVVAGVNAPADGALGGRLFSWHGGTKPPMGPAPIITSPVSSKTSIARVSLVGLYPGHYRVVCSRPDSGSVAIPFEVEP
jgi:hypothetical protein